MTDDTRAAFEKWALESSNGLCRLQRDGDGYSDIETDGAWQGWNAHAAQCADSRKLPESRPIP